MRNGIGNAQCGGRSPQEPDKEDIGMHGGDRCAGVPVRQGGRKPYDKEICHCENMSCTRGNKLKAL